MIDTPDLAALATASDNAEKSQKALIIDGQNNHAEWPKTTVMMKQYLVEHGGFDVDVARTQFTWKGGELLKEFPLGDGKQYEDLKKPKSDPDFAPDLANTKSWFPTLVTTPHPGPKQRKRHLMTTSLAAVAWSLFMPPTIRLAIGRPSI